jgi:hypothetical protein
MNKKTRLASERCKALNTTDPYELMRAVLEIERRARIEGKNEGLLIGFESGLNYASKAHKEDLDEVLKEFSS